jgi:hypothetical protein
LHALRCPLEHIPPGNDSLMVMVTVTEPLDTWRCRVDFWTRVNRLQPTCQCRKRKVKQSHYTPWRRLRGEEYSSTTSALDGSEWSASRSGRVLPRGKDPGTHCTGGWEGPRAGLDTEATGKILCPCRGSNPVARSSSP